MVDVTIYGAGVFGLSVGWALVRRGAAVRIIDPGGVAAGASGGLVGALAPHTPENWNEKKAFQFDSLIGAGAFWGEVAAAGGGDPGYARTGRLQPVSDARALELARAREAGAATFWQGRAAWDVIRAAGTGWEPVSPTGWLIRDTLSARLHPRRATEALALAIRARGGGIVTAGPEAGLVVWATGVAGLAALSEGRSRSVGNGVKGQAALLRHDARTLPQLFADGLHVVPHGDGTVAVGSTSEREFDSADATDGQLDAILDRVRLAVPALAGAPVLERWAGVRPRARSRAPMLGAWPGRPGHFIANGGFKIGFGMAPKVGAVMADLVLEGRNGIPEGFDVTANL